MIGVTLDTPGLYVAARIFNSGGPVTGWLAMTNFDGNSYNLVHTYAAVGAYSVKKVVFSDSGFTTRDPNYPEGDDVAQVVDVASVVLDAAISAHDTVGSVGGAIATGGLGGGDGVVGFVQDNGPIVALVTGPGVLGLVDSE